MSRSFNINFTWPFAMGMAGLILAGSFVVKAIVGAFTGDLSLQGSFMLFIMALIFGGLSWLFVRVAQANQEAEEEANS